ncbi:MAG: hypothetical protein ABIC40_06285, partial [bacterium]
MTNDEKKKPGVPSGLKVAGVIVLIAFGGLSSNYMGAMQLTTGTPAVMAFETYGIALLIMVLIESIVFTRMLGIGFLKALGFSLIVNIFSALFGLVFGSVAGAGLYFFVLPIFVIYWWISRKSCFPLWVNALIIGS